MFISSDLDPDSDSDDTSEIPLASSSELSLVPKPLDESEVDELPQASEKAVEDAVVCSTEMLDYVARPVKACHCQCTLGPGGSRCMAHFSGSELDAIK